MPNTSLLNKLLAISPYVEVIVRHLYWNNINIIKKFLALFHENTIQQKVIIDDKSFDKILNYLSDNGVTKGSLLIIHSAYRPLSSTGKSPEQIIQCLIDYLGPKGTLAMPAMPKFINDINPIDYINKDISSLIFNYDVHSTRVTTGVLPKTLCSWPGAVRSRYPINTMVALGPLAISMMEKNLQGHSPLPCGTNSSWNYCHENDAFVVALGVDMAHSLTMIHVAEDLLDEKWPIQNWYRDRNFVIKDGDFITKTTLRERHPRWGTLHYAERTLCKDMINKNIMRSTEINGITVECLRAKKLISYLNSRNISGYPYYGVRKYVKKKAKSNN